MNPIKLTSPDGKMFVHACGKCGMTAASEDAAERCCTCHLCGAEQEPRTFRACQDCTTRLAAEYTAKELALPAAEGYDGPTYTDAASPGWFATPEEAAEAVWDQSDGNVDWPNVIAFAAIVRPVSTPDLVSHVGESWWEQLEDAEFDGPLADELADLTKRIAASAPTVWEARRERVILTRPEGADE